VVIDNYQNDTEQVCLGGLLGLVRVRVRIRVRPKP
jgi:hypothetical protein